MAKELVKRETSGPMIAFQDMEGWIEDAFRRPSSLLSDAMMRFSPLKVMEDKGDIVVKAELPDVKKEDIDITLTDHTITICGEKKKEEEVKKKGYHYESSYVCFCLTSSLPSEVQSNKAKTKMKDGVLELRIPKTEEAKKKGFS